MRKMLGIVVVAALACLPVSAAAEFDPSTYKPVTQADLVKDPAVHIGKKYQIVDEFQFCGSDFCVQIQKMKFDTRQYWCFNLGSPCLMRMYLKKDHPQAPVLQKLRRGDRVRVYGTFDRVGAGFDYLLVDQLVLEKGR